MGIRSHVAASTATLALALFFISPATAQPVALTKTQSAALDAYNDAVSSFKSILSQRRAQINSNQALPNLPGQALYLARNKMMGARTRTSPTLFRPKSDGPTSSEFRRRILTPTMSR